MSESRAPDYGPVVHVQPGAVGADVLVVCEHASNRIPEPLGDLGLSAEALQSHIAWDPGALAVAEALAEQLHAPMVHGGSSRLVYDCNRPPEAADAVPSRSEVHDIPGNAGLTPAERKVRVKSVYFPFRDRLAQEIAVQKPALRLLVTVHSFNPVFHGKRRETEIGILHGRDSRFALAMLAAAPDGLPYVTRLNEPYSAADGVVHTLDLHGFTNGLQNVMLEIRNDLIRTRAEQVEMAGLLAPWIAAVLDRFERKGAA